MFPQRSSFVFFIASLLALGCGEVPVVERPDAGREDVADAGAHDAGRLDAGSLDAGGLDAGGLDGGGLDAGGLDAGGLDAGDLDAGGLDAGDLDAGHEGADAGQPDAGAVDAGNECGCATGLCLGDGGCGECESAADCPAARPVCGPANTCLECAESPTDTCLGGRYCNQGHCVTGCRDGSMCTSGVCLLDSNDCFNCQLDSQCTNGALCSSGQCHASCTTDQTCPSGWSCCDGRCVDPSRDVHSCGLTCGQTCVAGSFCGGGICHASVLDNVCHEPVVRVLHDGYETDDTAGDTIGGALVGLCQPAVSLLTGDQDAGYLDATTGEPLQTGELLVMGGGSFGQRGIAWLEKTSRARVTDTSTATDLRYSRDDGGVVFSTALSNISATHDVFLVQLTSTPRGSLVLNASGFVAEGTSAASWYVVNQLLPKLGGSTLTDGWYVVEWLDASDAGPDATDTWTLIASGH